MTTNIIYRKIKRRISQIEKKILMHKLNKIILDKYFIPDISDIILNQLIKKNELFFIINKRRYLHNNTKQHL